MEEPNLIDYMIRYKEYLIDNNLADDSATISDEDLIDFVENHIEDGEEGYAAKRTRIGDTPDE